MAFKFARVSLVAVLLLALALAGCSAGEESPSPPDKEEVMSVQITLQVSQEVARVLHQQGTPTPDSQELLRVAEELGVILRPVHPGKRDPLLAPYFIIDAPNAAEAQTAIARLSGLKAVQAAYVKPADELP